MPKLRPVRKLGASFYIKLEVADIKDYEIDGNKVNVLQVAMPNPTSPGFPCVVNLIPKQNVIIKINGLMHAISSTQYRDIPVISQ